MHEAILQAKSELDSLGAVIECVAYNVPAGLGDPMFDGMESRIARIAFGIPGVKGVEFGEGFGATLMRGSEHNDPFCMQDGHPHMATNHAGGILGGITCGTGQGRCPREVPNGARDIRPRARAAQNR